MKVSFKDINGIYVEGELEYIYPRLSQDGKIHSWYFCIKLTEVRFIKGICYKIEDCKFMLDKDENPALYPCDAVEKLKSENTRLKEEMEKTRNSIPTETATKLNAQNSEMKILTEKNIALQEQNERVCKENEELKEKLAEYEQHAKLIKDVDDLLKKSYPPFKENFEPSQGFKDFIKGLQDYTAKLELIPLIEIPVVHLNSFEDCQKLDAEPIKSDNYDDIINSLLNFRTRVQHEHISAKSTVLQLIEIILKLAREVQGDERKAN